MKEEAVSKIDQLIELSMLSRRFFRALSKMQDGTTMAQVDLLMFIKFHPESTMREIAEIMDVSFAAVTPLVDKLILNGYLLRVGEKSDRRIIKLVITNQGAEFLADKMKEMQGIMNKIFGNLTESELNEYIRIHRKVVTGCPRLRDN